MFGLAPSEILIIVIVALVCIGPSDLPRAMKTAAKWMSAGRKLAREFQGHVDELVREAELDELREQAKKLSSQSLASHLESFVDPDQGLASTFSSDNLFADVAKEQSAAVAAAEETAALPSASEPMLPGFTPEGAAGATVAEAETAPTAVPAQGAHGG